MFKYSAFLENSPVSSKHYIIFVTALSTASQLWFSFMYWCHSGILPCIIDVCARCGLQSVNREVFDTTSAGNKKIFHLTSSEDHLFGVSAFLFQLFVLLFKDTVSFLWFVFDKKNWFVRCFREGYSAVLDYQDYLWSGNRIVFRITDHLWVESTRHWWIPLTKDQWIPSFHILNVANINNLLSKRSSYLWFETM